MKMVERTVLITGGTSGIGMALAKQSAARGNRHRDASGFIAASLARHHISGAIVPDLTPVRRAVGN